MLDDVIPTVIEMGVFNVSWDLQLRMCPEPLSAAWWSETSGVVDVKSAQSAFIFCFTNNVQ
jgi:hypothetical protein